MTHKVTLILTKTMELSDLEEPESSFELTDEIEELEEAGWSVEIQSVNKDGRDDEDED